MTTKTIYPFDHRNGQHLPVTLQHMVANLSNRLPIATPTSKTCDPRPVRSRCLCPPVDKSTLTCDKSTLFFSSLLLFYMDISCVQSSFKSSLNSQNISGCCRRRTRLLADLPQGLLGQRRDCVKAFKSCALQRPSLAGSVFSSTASMSLMDIPKIFWTSSKLFQVTAISNVASPVDQRSHWSMRSPKHQASDCKI